MRCVSASAEGPQQVDGLAKPIEDAPIAKCEGAADEHDPRRFRRPREIVS